MSGRTGKEKILAAKYIAVTIFITVFVVGIIFGFYSRLYEEKRSGIIKDGRMAAMQVSDLLENYLDMNIDSVKLTAYALDQMISDKRSDSEIQDYLVDQSTAIKTAVDENSTGFYGYINGRFFSGTNWEPPEDYVATGRPWYTKPLSAAGKITLLDPYHDVQSGNMMLAVGKTLCDGVSVLSIDISLDRLQTIMENALMLENADTEMILNENGTVIAHSDVREMWNNYSSENDTLGSAVFSELNRTGDDCFEVYFRNSHYIVCAAKIQNDWHCISVTDATEVFSRLDALRALTVTAAFVIIVIFAAIMINSGRRQFLAEELNAQLSSTADIYISLHEINFFTDTFSTIRSTNSDADDIIGKSKHNCQDLIFRIMEKCSDPSSRESILDFVDFGKLNHRLEGRSTITAEFLSADQKWRRARFIVSERIPGGKVARAMFLVEDIDTEKRERDRNIEAIKTMNEQISSIANIYFTMQDIDLKNDTLNEIKTRAKHVSELINGRKENAQATMYAVMDQMSHESSRKTIHEFIDLSTLDERLKNTNTITEEFLSVRNVWSRARFIVSQRASDGSIEHVLWLVEGIDNERRRRDSIIRLSERAIAANEAKTSFISKMSHNIRMPIHAMLGMNELILRECNDEKIRAYSGNIRTSGAALLGLVNDLLDISSIEEGRTQITAAEYDISCMISDLVNMIQPDADYKSLSFAIEVVSDIPRILRGDETHIRKVLMNLLSNAVNPTNKGSVTFSIYYEDIPDDPDGIILDIFIKDTGVGMAPEEIKRLLNDDENIDSTQSLAVNIAGRLLKMMGSSLEVESMQGMGTVFSFRIRQEVVSREPLGNYEEAYKETLEKRRA